MSNYSITVDTGFDSTRRYTDESLAAFYRNVGVMQSAVENMKGSVRGLRTGLQRANHCFAQMGFAVRSVLSGLMNTKTVVDGLQAGMKNLYRYSRTWWKSFAGTLQSLAGNANYLRNSLAAMAAPMLKALAPAIEFVTDKFVGLFNLINQFFARLTGSSTYVAARRTSGSIDGVGSSASHAADDVRKLNRQLMAFDELNVLTEQDDDSGGGSGGAGGAGGGVQFEERQIDNALAGFVDALKAAFNAGDWQELGTLIGGKINEMFDNVDWAAAGTKVGKYINGLFTTAYWTLDTVNFTNIGKDVAVFLNNALAEIDFSTVGATIALLFTSLAETIAGFVEEFDWVQFAEKLADGLNGFVSKLGEKLDDIDWAGLALKMTEGLNAFIARTDWANAGKVLAGRVNDLLAILGTAAEEFDWTGAGKALATAVNNLFKNVDWEALGKWLNKTLQGVLDFGIAFFEGFDAVGFANDVGKALAQVDWDAVSEKLWTLFKAALARLGEFFGTLLFGGSADMKLNLALLRDGWETITKWLGIDKPLSALIALLKNNWQTIARFLGIEDPLSALVGLVKNNWQTIAKWLGIEDPLSALIGLVKNNWTSIATFVGTAVTVLTSLGKKNWTDISSFVGTVVSVVANLVSKGSNWLKLGGITKWFGGGKDPLASIIGNLTSTGSNWQKLGGITKWFGGGKNPVSNFLANLTGKSKDSKTTKQIFGASFNTKSKLTGKTTDSKTNQGVHGASFKTASKLTGKTEDSKTNQQVHGASFKTSSNLTGATSDSKTNQQVHGASFKTSSKLVGKTDDSKTNQQVHGASFKTSSNLTGAASDSKTLSQVHGNTFSSKSKLTGKSSDSKTLTDVFGSTFTVVATLSSTIHGLTGFVKTIVDKVKEGLKNVGNAEGGIISNSGHLRRFAAGGVISGGVARYLKAVPHYAGGTTRAHGTVFVAGEAGPEIMGHINGRTEILNKSQMAQTMYSAVLAAMSQAVSALGTFLSGQLANCTNAIVKTLGGLSGVANIRYHEPVMASGTVLPYDVAAQIARTGMDIQNTLDANNEDLIQTIISVAGQIVAAVQNSGNREQGTGGRNDLTAQQLIDDINRRAQMFGSSPLLN